MKKIAYILLLFFAITCGFKGWHMRMENHQERAVHPDEGEQTWTFARLLVNGDYKYDAQGSHGPILYYWPLLFIGESDIPTFDVKDLRHTMVPIFVLSAFSIFGFTALGAQKKRRGEPCTITAVAAGAFATMLFSFSSLSQIYSTYYVQEAFFALFSLWTAYAFFFLCKSPSVRAALCLGVSAGLLQVSKETSVFIYASAFAAYALMSAFKPAQETARSIELFKSIKLALWIKIFFAALLPAFLIYALLNSSFGANPRGILDGVSSYFTHYLEKSAGTAHSKDFFYYFKLLIGQKRDYIFFGESAIFGLSVVGTIFSFVRRNDAMRYISLFAWIQLIILSVITYKTPWLALAPVCALCIVGGYGASELLRFSFKPAFAANALKAAIFIGVLFLGYLQFTLARNASQKYPNDPRNPFIYVHTLKDSENLVERVRNANRVLGGKLEILIAMENSPWPLPWQFIRQGATPDIARSQNKIGDISKYDIIIYDSAFDSYFKNKFDDKGWLEEFFGLRENLLLRVRIKRDLFEKSINLAD